MILFLMTLRLFSQAQVTNWLRNAPKRLYIKQRSMVLLGTLDPAGVLLRSGQLNEFNAPGGGQDEVNQKQS